jgi:hypothetical protein
MLTHFPTLRSKYFQNTKDMKAVGQDEAFNQQSVDFENRTLGGT